MEDDDDMSTDDDDDVSFDVVVCSQNDHEHKCMFTGLKDDSCLKMCTNSFKN